ncbi:hypothetical protein BJ165DRAFT_1397571 [Panaeolus papilionaceus]|nr:hypothetical protein BJ165DRAFT_1397571 [Panaeolus papilionaceus]
MALICSSTLQTGSLLITDSSLTWPRLFCVTRLVPDNPSGISAWRLFDFEYFPHPFNDFKNAGLLKGTWIILACKDVENQSQLYIHQEIQEQGAMPYEGKVETGLTDHSPG